MSLVFDPSSLHIRLHCYQKHRFLKIYGIPFPEGDVFLNPVCVAKCRTDKFHIFLFDEFHYIVHCVVHVSPPANQCHSLSLLQMRHPIAYAPAGSLRGTGIKDQAEGNDIALLILMDTCNKTIITCSRIPCPRLPQFG